MDVSPWPISANPPPAGSPPRRRPALPERVRELDRQADRRIAALPGRVGSIRAAAITLGGAGGPGSSTHG